MLWLSRVRGSCERNWRVTGTRNGALICPKSSSRWGATMSYWLGVETPEVWAEANRTHDLNHPVRFGFPEGRRKSVQQINVGDRIINYMTKHRRFFAVWEVTGRYVHDPNQRFAGKVFPECV